MELPTYGNARETYSALLETVELAAVAVCQLLQRPDGSRCMPYASEAARFLFGVTVTDADEAGAQALANLHPEDVATVKAGLETAIRGLANLKTEFRQRGADGVWRWLSGSSSVRRLPDGGTLWHSVYFDITAQRQAVEDLRASEERLKVANETAQVGVWERDVRTGRVTWDDICLAQYRLTREEFSNSPQDWEARLHPEDRERMKRAVCETVDGTSAFRPTFRILWPDGQVRHLTGTSRVMRDDAGVPIRIIGTSWDITERKRTEDTLRASEERLKVALSSGHVGIWETDLQSGVTTWDEAMPALYGRAPGEFSGTYDEWLSFLHPDDRPVALGGLLGLVESSSRETHAYRVVWPDGSVHTLKGQAAAVRDEAGKVVRLIGANWDDTAYAAAQRQLQFASAAISECLTAIFWLKLDGRVAYANPYACASLGYTQAELLGQSVTDFSVNLEAEYWFRRTSPIRRTQPSTFTAVHRRKDGSVFPVEGASSYIGFQGEEYICCFVLDISERERAAALRRELEAAVREAKQLLEVMVEHMPAAVFLKRADDLSLEVVNRAAEKLFRLPRTALLGKSNKDFGVKGQDDFFTASDREALASTGIVEVPEWELATSGEESRYLTTSKIALRDEQGVARYVLAISTDITARKQAEVRQAALEAQVRESKRLLESMIEHMPVAIFLKRADDLRVELVNRAAEKAWGIARSELIGRSNYEFGSQEQGDAFTLSDNAALQSDDIVELPEFVLSIPGGTERHVTVWKVALRDEQGKPRYLLNIASDITARKQAEDQRRELEGQLRESQKMEAIGTLAGGIAHDFNNALATILGNLEIARLDARGRPSAQRSLNEIEKAGIRARDLVQQILTFSRRQPSERKPLDIAAMVMDGTHLLRASLPARLRLDVRCAPDLPRILGNTTQILQVLINLGTNAMQAIGGQQGRVEIAVDEVMLDAELAATDPLLAALYASNPGRVLRLGVSDNGPGMAASIRERVFDPFFTTKAPGEGTGLGLSVVHGIVQNHGGVITVRSEPGQGATFQVYLPIAAQLPQEPPLPFFAPPALQAPDSGCRILYVDDDPDLALMVERLLEIYGYRVSTHNNPFTALSALRADPAAFDLVVTDFNMPGLSGLEVAREVRGIRSDLPVALTSGFLDETARVQAGEAGVRELIYKGGDVREFCSLVQRLVAPAAKARGPAPQL